MVDGPATVAVHGALKLRMVGQFCSQSMEPKQAVFQA